jgi:hypothetical protein
MQWISCMDFSALMAMFRATHLLLAALAVDLPLHHCHKWQRIRDRA